MADAEVSLGGIELVSSTSGLQLHLESCAQLASSADDADGILDRLTHNSTKDIWITRGNGFRLVIRLSLDVEILNRACTASAFAHSLYNAELWEQLHLQASSIEVTNDDHAKASIITLRLSGASVSLNSRLHKLADGVPFDDVHPSAGVQEVDMHSVQLCIRVTAQQFSKTSTTRPSTSVTVPFRRYINVEDATHRLSEFIDGDMLLDTIERDADVAQEPFSREVLPLNRVRSPRIAPKSEDLTLEQSLLELLHAGLRQAIFVCPKRGSKGISVSRSESFRPLADIAPAIWSPGYHLAVSRRAVLIPAISHSLNRVGMVSAHRTSLRTKMEEVARRSGQGSAPHCARARSSQSDQTVIGERLWQIAQTSLLEPEALWKTQFLERPSRTADRDLQDINGGHIPDAALDFTLPDVMLDEDVKGSPMPAIITAPDAMSWRPYVKTPPSDNRRMPAREVISADEPDETESWRAHSGLEDDMLSICDSIASVMLTPAVNTYHSDAHDLEQEEWTCLDGWEDHEEEMLIAN